MFVILYLLLLQGCTQIFHKEALDAVRERTREPESVKFRNITVKRNNHANVVYVCGEYNAKNAYGGYVGYEFFVASEDGSEVYTKSSPPSFAVDGDPFSFAYKTFCAD